MLYREIPKTGDKLSILGYGCMRFPGGALGVDEKKAIEQLRYAMDKGINYFDTAWPYHGGKSEGILGKALKEGYREKVKIADKLPHWLCKNTEDMDYYLNEQLKRLDTDKIDYYLIHALDGPSWEKVKSLGVIDFINKAKESGKIVNAGFSFHGLKEEFKAIIDDYDWDFCQIQYNILDKHFQAGIDGLTYAHSKNIGVIVMEPLRGGSLAGKLPPDVEKIYENAKTGWSNAEWSLRWIWNHPGVITILSGMNDQSQIDENIKIAGEAGINSLSEEKIRTVEKAAEKFISLMKVPCTSCQYCMPCPKNVNIPSAFTFYNEKYLFKKGFMSRMFYLMQLGKIGDKEPMLASRCVDCGICVKKCPQKIDIPAELKHVKKDFEGFLSKPLLFMIKAVMSKGKRKKSKSAE